MSTEEMVAARREQLIAKSPILNQIKREDEQREYERRNQTTVPEWNYTPEELEMILSDDGVPDNTEPQLVSIPDPNAQQIRQDLDMVQMQLDDDDRGYDRPNGQWSPQYLRPNRRTVRGRDLATGEKILERGDSSNERSMQHLNKGIDLLRQSNNSITDGPDADGMRGLTHLARSIQAEGQNYDEFMKAADMYSAPESALQAAWGAADAAETQETLDNAFAAPVSQAEIDELPDDDGPLYSEPGLVLEDRWMSAAQQLWEVEHRQPYTGSQQALSEWAINEMSNFNWTILPGLNSSSMAYYATRAWYESQYDDGKYAQALYDLIEMYDNTETDLNTIARSTVAAFRDPSMYIGASSVSKPVVKAVAKNRMTKWLSKVIGEKAAQRVGQNALVGTVEGAAYTGAEDAMRQSVAMNAGWQEKFDVGQNVTAQAVGATVGNVAGAAFGELLSPQAIAAYKAAGSRMLSNAGKPRMVSLQTGAVGDLSQLYPGRKDILSTRIPFAKGETEDPLANYLSAGIEAMPDALLDKNLRQMEAWPSIKPARKNATLQNRREHVIEQLVDNLLWLHDQMDPGTRAQARQWYDGARGMAAQFAREHGLEPRQTAGIMAVLSPQKDWFQNMTQAERVLDIYRDRQDMVPDEAMNEMASRIYPAEKLAGQRWAEIKGKSLGELDEAYDKALFIRAFDEVHNPKSYRTIMPDGRVGDEVLTSKGVPARHGWGSMGEIAKAVSIIEDGSLENISSNIGGMHKVRNFYNNIVAPNSPEGQVTIDTHAINAALLNPMGGSAPEVMHGLGAGPTHAASGSRGSYPIFAEAYRRAAARRGLLPREMQSITWEEVRTLFNNKSGPVKKAVNTVWDKYNKGKITAQEAREEVYGIVGGAGEPAWAMSDSGANAEKWRPTYAGQLSGSGLPARSPQPVDGGAGDGAAGGDSTVVSFPERIVRADDGDVMLVKTDAGDLRDLEGGARYKDMADLLDRHPKVGKDSLYARWNKLKQLVNTHRAIEDIQDEQYQEGWISSKFEPMMEPFRQEANRRNLTDSEFIDEARRELAEALGGESNAQKTLDIDYDLNYKPEVARRRPPVNFDDERIDPEQMAETILYGVLESNYDFENAADLAGEVSHDVWKKSEDWRVDTPQAEAIRQFADELDQDRMLTNAMYGLRQSPDNTDLYDRIYNMIVEKLQALDDAMEEVDVPGEDYPRLRWKDEP